MATEKKLAEDAYITGVRDVLAIAAATATRLRAQPWRPTREGAAEALEAPADEAERLCGPKGASQA